MYERLEKAFERGLKGKVESFDVWLREVGFNPSKLQANYLTAFLTQLDVTVDRESELESIVEYLGYYARVKEGLFHIALFGPMGSGKTHLLTILKSFIERREIRLRTLYFNASTFSEQDEDEQRFLKHLESLKSEKPDVLIIDSCEEDRNIEYSIKEFLKLFRNGVLITAWEPLHWNFFKEKIETIVATSREIYLKPLSKDNTELLLSKITDYASDGKVKLDVKLAEKIHEFTLGIPGSIISLFLRALHEAFLKQKTSLDIESVEMAAQTMGLHDMFEKLKSLDELQLMILRNIILNSDPRGIRPSQLVEVLNRDKATVSYHLNKFVSERILHNERFGKFSFYRIKEELRPFIELRISQESEYLA
ncbi:MAG: DnaA ATPase domain-containing protein [Nitrososphaerales archaeon]